MVSTRMALKCVLTLQKYCMEHEFCTGCKLPRLKNGDCINPQKWQIPEICGYPELISREEFEKLFISNKDEFYQMIGQFQVDFFSKKVNEKFWGRIDDQFIGVKVFDGKTVIGKFSDAFDIQRFLSGWSKEDIEEFHDLEKDGLIQEEQEPTSETKNSEERKTIKTENFPSDLTLREFCLHHTRARELVAVTDSGYVVATVWIDYEDLFAIPERLANKKIKHHHWDTLTVTDADGNCAKIPCHYAEIED